MKKGNERMYQVPYQPSKSEVHLRFILKRSTSSNGTRNDIGNTVPMALVILLTSSFMTGKGKSLALRFDQ